MIRYPSLIRVTKLFGGIFAVVVLVAACGSDGGGKNGSAPKQEPAPMTVPKNARDLRGRRVVKIRIVDNEFEPSIFRVDPGAEIVFENRGRNPHNVTPAENGSFEGIPTEDLQPGKRASTSISDRGVYRYYCTLHGTPDRGQNGVIVVGDPR